MASKNKEPETGPIVAGQPEETGKVPELLGIEKLRSKHKISGAVFAGVCAANGWKPGKTVSVEEFLQAVSKFTKEPMRSSKPQEVRK